MECHEIKQLLPLHIGGELDDDVNKTVSGHLACCAVCAREAAFQSRLSGSLRELGCAGEQAPSELCSQVMGRLRPGRRSYFPKLPAAWQKAVAAAAAILLLAGGSAGVTAGLRMANNNNMLVYEAPTARVGEPGAPTAGSPGQDSAGGEIPFNILPNNGPEPSGTAGAGTENIPPEAGAGSEVTATAGTSPEVAPALMSAGMNITSTIIKVSVGDLAEARAKAVALAAGSGAATQVFPEQNGDKRIVVIRLTVPAESAPGLIAGLSGLGTLFDRQDENRDVAASYNETLVKYHDLQSRINSTQDASEQGRMETEAASYKQMLEAWKAESGQRVITLWLEGS